MSSVKIWLGLIQMARQFKFRIWHKKEKRWLDPWAEEDPILSLKDFGRGCEVYLYDRKTQDHSNVNCQMDDVVIQQYTGLNDRNDKEIYEGDILDSLYGESVGDQTAYEVRWAKCYAGERWCEFLVRAEDGAEIIGNLKPHNFYGGISFTSERTIIGNIFEGIKYEKN